MRPQAWVAARSIASPRAGGQVWVYLNWCLGLLREGVDVVWLEPVQPDMPAYELAMRLEHLRALLAPHGIPLAVCSWSDEPLAAQPDSATLPLDAARDAAFLLNIAYDLPATTVRMFRRAVLLDIDPGLTQTWLRERLLRIAPHHVYVTTGERVKADSDESAWLPWHYVPPCVDLGAWAVSPVNEMNVFTTVSRWASREQVFDGVKWYRNDKRSGFLPFIEMPRLAEAAIFELSLSQIDSPEDRRLLEWNGWRIQDASLTSGTPMAYQQYIQRSYAEFSCAKPSCVSMQNAWISDRTLCYLATGRPAVVQHTGPSRLLPEREGVLRFSSRDEARSCVESVACDYQRHSSAARALVEEHFSAARSARRLLEFV